MDQEEPWDHVVRLRFPDAFSIGAGMQEVHKWIRRLEQRAQRGVTWSCGMHRQASSHGLALLFCLSLRGTVGVGASGLKAAWAGNEGALVIVGDMHPSQG